MVHSNDVQCSAHWHSSGFTSPGLTLLEGTPIQASQMLQVLPSSAKLAKKNSSTRNTSGLREQMQNHCKTLNQNKTAVAGFFFLLFLFLLWLLLWLWFWLWWPWWWPFQLSGLALMCYEECITQYRSSVSCQCIHGLYKCNR